MRIEFASNKLRKCYEKQATAIRQWGRDVGVRYRQVVDTIESVELFEDLYKYRYLRLHVLRGKRAGQYAITILGRHRLILVPKDNGRTAVIEDVVDYHD